MNLVIVITLAVALLAILVLVLHRFQVSEAQQNADKNLPLPPLEAPDLAESGEQASPADSIEPKPPARSTSTPRAKAETGVEKTEVTTNASWLDKVSELKKSNHLVEALQLCEKAYPLWSAFQQAALIRRAQIKELVKQGESTEELIESLYCLAARAELLHSRVKGLPELSLAQLKQLDLTEIDQFAMPYTKIGYHELRLIKKTDIKLLLDTWGKPESHVNPRQYHASKWSALAKTQNTLF